MNLIVVEAIRGRCASFTVLTATVSDIFGGQTTPSNFTLGCLSIYYNVLLSKCRRMLFNTNHNCIFRNYQIS